MLFEQKYASRTLDRVTQLMTFLVAALFAAAGAMKITGAMNQQFLEWGFIPSVPTMIGSIEIVAAFALLFRRTAGWSALALMVVMVGAIRTHFVHGEMLATIVPAVLFVLLGGIAWIRGLPIKTAAPRPQGSGMPAQNPATVVSA